MLTLRKPFWIYEGDTPPPAYCLILTLRTAYCLILTLRTAYRLTKGNKENIIVILD